MTEHEDVRGFVGRGIRDLHQKIQAKDKRIAELEAELLSTQRKHDTLLMRNIKAEHERGELDAVLKRANAVQGYALCRKQEHLDICGNKRRPCPECAYEQAGRERDEARGALREIRQLEERAIATGCGHNGNTYAICNAALTKSEEPQ